MTAFERNRIVHELEKIGNVLKAIELVLDRIADQMPRKEDDGT